jgi:hypothetical protein
MSTSPTKGVALYIHGAPKNLMVFEIKKISLLAMWHFHTDSHHAQCYLEFS